MILLTAQPNELKYVWEVILYLESLKKIGWEDKAHVLVYCKTPKRPEWDKVHELFPNAQIFFYEADQSVINLERVYIPILRLYCIKEHWKKYPYLEKQTIFYTDSDIVFTSRPDIDKFLNDDVCYLSSTVFPNDYMSHKYFESKVNQVDPPKLEAYNKRDILGELARQVGLDKQVIIDNHDNTGGAQWLIKNVTQQFWEDAYSATITIRLHLMNVNFAYFPGRNSAEQENNGFQSWCADMWGVLWTLWKHGKKTLCPPELAFAWATDKVERLDTISILHNAGIVSDSKIRIRGTNDWVDIPAFYKGKTEYLTGQSTPFRDLEYVASAAAHKEFCTGLYAQHILDVQSKYNLNI